VNTIWSRERALTHLEYIRRLWDATIEGERAGQSLDEAEERLSLDNDFAFVKNMQVYKERGDDWVRPQHQSHVRVFFLQHKNMACDVLRKGLETSPETAVADIRSQRDRGSNIYFDEASMNGLGYELLTASRNAEAIEVFRLNAEVFPGSANAQDGLAEAYMKTGKRDKAIEHYKRSLELNSENENARDKLMELEEE
jgi:tetratricopeptide (TPR) repeat protein